MIKFKNLSKQLPYKMFFEAYNNANNNNQENIEAIVISSYDALKNQVDSRFVNIKFIEHDEFIFFTNYDSPKSIAFQSHEQISACFFWSKINTQIRMKANIKKTSHSYNNNYFKTRSFDKNALAISSRQSKKIDSYSQVKEKYNRSLKNDNLKECPEYWGGFSFTPYYFEFWEGHKSRINKREVFDKIDGVWKQSFLQP